MATPPASPAIEAQPPAVELESFELLWPALADAVETFDIPTELLHAIIEGVRRDVYPTPPADWPELVDYCYHVASAVGLACVHIWKQEPEIPTQAAVDCGIAFQLTNILRDVAEDARQGRLYLPLTELQRFQIDPDQWLNGQPNGRWPELIEHVAHRAEEYYQRGWPTIESLSPRSRRMFSLMWCSYRMLLGRVVARRHRLWQTPRIGLSTIQRFHLLARHMVSSPNQR